MGYGKPSRKASVDRVREKVPVEYPVYRQDAPLVFCMNFQKSMISFRIDRYIKLFQLDILVLTIICAMKQ